MMLSQPGGLHGFAYHILSNRLRRVPAWWLPSRPKDLSSITTWKRARALLQVFRCAHATLIRHPTTTWRRKTLNIQATRHTQWTWYYLKNISVFLKNYIIQDNKARKSKHFCYFIERNRSDIWHLLQKKSEIASVFCSMYLLTRSTQCEKLFY